MVMQTTIAHSTESNVFHVRFDTMTVQAGNTAIVNVLYTFDTGHSHGIQGFTAHFSYDTNEVFIDYITSGTASAGFWDTIGSRHGFAAFSTTGQELDLTNPVLFKMRVIVNKKLGDTAFIRWDSLFPLFNDASYGVDSVIEQDGWVQTATSAGHVALSIPGDSLTGRYHDSVAFTAPVRVSSLIGANVSHIQLRYLFDPRYIFNRGAHGGSETKVDSLRHHFDFARGYDTVWIWVSSNSGSSLLGSDTLVNLDLSAIAYADWNCTTLWDVRYKPLDTTALVGNVDVHVDTFCVLGSLDGVETVQEGTTRVVLYPNPARTFINVPTSGEDCDVSLFDQLGRCCTGGSVHDGRFGIPEGVLPGTYRVVIEGERSHERHSASITILR